MIILPILQNFFATNSYVVVIFLLIFVFSLLWRVMRA